MTIKSILMYDTDTGALILRIRNTGKGPGEYVSLYDMLIDTTGNYIELLDMNGKKVVRYDMNGDFKEKYSDIADFSTKAARHSYVYHVTNFVENNQIAVFSFRNDMKRY